MEPSVIIKPLTTEKALHMAKQGKYMFLVRDAASKHAVKNLIQSLYGVKVSKLNVMRTHQKTKLGKGGSPAVKRADGKKMIVTLKGGKTIDVYKVKEAKK